MGKNKHLKYKRVKYLPNVTIFEDLDILPTGPFPWSEKSHHHYKETVLELGCGKGEHSLAFAQKNPDTLYIGVDSKSHRMCVGAEKAIESNQKNVHFLRARIEHIERFFSKNSIREIWLTFPDPHPKNRSAKFRLTSPPFLDKYATLLKPEGTLNLKTDSDFFYNFTLASVKKWGGRVIQVSGNIHDSNEILPCAPDVVSAYEKAARGHGEDIKFAAFKLS